jgi:hypothetical protein
MANRYVRNGGSNTSPYDTWAKAASNLATATTGSAAGDVFYVAADHSENYASTTTITFPGTATAPNYVYCVDHTGSVPPTSADVRTGADVTTSAASSLALLGMVHVYGLDFAIGTGTSSASLSLASSASTRQSYEQCLFALIGTGTSGRINVGTGQSCYIEWRNCTVRLNRTLHAVVTGGGSVMIWKNDAGFPALHASTVYPTALYVPATTNQPARAEWSGLDLSGMGSNTIVSAGVAGSLILLNCTVSATAVIAGAQSFHALGVRLIGCHSPTGGNAARNEKHTNRGTLTTETTIVRTDGASDGVTPYSWKVVTTASGDEREFPFETFEGAIWNDDVGVAKTLTVHIVTDNVSLTDTQIWLAAEYLGDANTPISTLTNDGPATPLTAGVAQDTSTETWTTTGIATPLKQKLEVTFTPEMAGPVRWRVKIARASTTIYICPKAELA